MHCWLAGWLVGWLAGWLAGWTWLAGWLDLVAEVAGCRGNAGAGGGSNLLPRRDIRGEDSAATRLLQ